MELNYKIYRLGSLCGTEVLINFLNKDIQDLIRKIEDINELRNSSKRFYQVEFYTDNSLMIDLSTVSETLILKIQID